MNGRRVTPATGVLLGLLLAAALLVGVELVRGAADYGSGTVANPCRERSFAGAGLDAAVQRIVLDGLDGAACRLGTSREELVLSLGVGEGFPPRRWDRRTIEVALRAGMLGAVDRAAQRGEIPGFLVPLVRRAVRSLPLEQLIRGAVSLGDLIG